MQYTHTTDEHVEDESKRIIPADNFAATVNANVDNDRLTDAEFREFIRTSLPFIIYTGAE